MLTHVCSACSGSQQSVACRIPKNDVSSCNRGTTSGRLRFVRGDVLLAVPFTEHMLRPAKGGGVLRWVCATIRKVVCVHTGRCPIVWIFSRTLERLLAQFGQSEFRRVFQTWLKLFALRRWRSEGLVHDPQLVGVASPGVGVSRASCATIGPSVNPSSSAVVDADNGVLPQQQA